MRAQAAAHVGRRAEAARPQIREQRIGVVRLALLGAVRVRGLRLLLGEIRDAVRRLGRGHRRAIVLVGRERFLRRGARLVERLLGRVDDVVLRGALLLELLASLLGARDLRVDLGLRDLALREQRAHALARRVERRRNRRRPRSRAGASSRARSGSRSPPACRRSSSAVERASRVSMLPISLRVSVSVRSIKANTSLPVRDIALPLRDRGAGRRHRVLALQNAAALPADDVVLDDAVVALVGRDAVERGFVDAQAPRRTARVRPSSSLVIGSRSGLAVRRERLRRSSSSCARCD